LHGRDSLASILTSNRRFTYFSIWREEPVRPQLNRQAGSTFTSAFLSETGAELSLSEAASGSEVTFQIAERQLKRMGDSRSLSESSTLLCITARIFYLLLLLITTIVFTEPGIKPLTNKIPSAVISTTFQISDGDRFATHSSGHSFTLIDSSGVVVWPIEPGALSLSDCPCVRGPP